MFIAPKQFKKKKKSEKEKLPTEEGNSSAENKTLI